VEVDERIHGSFVRETVLMMCGPPLDPMHQIMLENTMHGLGRGRPLPWYNSLDSVFQSAPLPLRRVYYGMKKIAKSTGLFPKLTQVSPLQPVENFSRFALPMIRKVYPSLIAQKLINVQPITYSWSWTSEERKKELIHKVSDPRCDPEKDLSDFERELLEKILDESPIN